MIRKRICSSSVDVAELVMIDEEIYLSGTVCTVRNTSNPRESFQLLFIHLARVTVTSLRENCDRVYKEAISLAIGSKFDSPSRFSKP